MSNLRKRAILGGLLFALLLSPLCPALRQTRAKAGASAFTQEIKELYCGVLLDFLKTDGMYMIQVGLADVDFDGIPELIIRWHNDDYQNTDGYEIYAIQRGEVIFADYSVVYSGDFFSMQMTGSSINPPYYYLMEDEQGNQMYLLFTSRGEGVSATDVVRLSTREGVLFSAERYEYYGDDPELTCTVNGAEVSEAEMVSAFHAAIQGLSFSDAGGHNMVTPYVNSPELISIDNRSVSAVRQLTREEIMAYFNDYLPLGAGASLETSTETGTEKGQAGTPGGGSIEAGGDDGQASLATASPTLAPTEPGKSNTGLWAIIAGGGAGLAAIGAIIFRVVKAGKTVATAGQASAGQSWQGAGGYQSSGASPYSQWTSQGAWPQQPNGYQDGYQPGYPQRSGNPYSQGKNQGTWPQQSTGYQGGYQQSSENPYSQGTWPQQPGGYQGGYQPGYPQSGGSPYTQGAGPEGWPQQLSGYQAGYQQNGGNPQERGEQSAGYQGNGQRP